MDGKCPYTGLCFGWHCDECENEQEEREWMAQMDEAEMYDENGDPYRDFEGNPW